MGLFRHHLVQPLESNLCPLPNKHVIMYRHCHYRTPQVQPHLSLDLVVAVHTQSSKCQVEQKPKIQLSAAIYVRNTIR